MKNTIKVNQLTFSLPQQDYCKTKHDTKTSQVTIDPHNKRKNTIKVKQLTFSSSARLLQNKTGYKEYIASHKRPTHSKEGYH